MIELTTEQQQAHDTLLDFLFSDKKSIILQGFAGTGKSTIISHVEQSYYDLYEFNKLLADNTQYEWRYTALTNKAKNSLATIINKQVTTLHNFLRLSLNNNFRVAHYNPTILVVDECSFIDRELFKCLELTQQANDIKIIYMGDKYQLPPVGEDISPVFLQDYPTIQLTKPVRQTNSPFIAQLCDNFRKAIDTGEITSFKCDDKEVTWLERPAFKKAVIDEFKDGLRSKFIALTNNKAQQYNKMCFEKYFNRKEFNVGDKVVNNAYYFGIPTDEELTISHIQTFNTDYNGEIITGKCYSFEETAITMYVADKKHTWLPEKYLGDIRASYACTIHKSQGATYDKVFIDLQNLASLYKRDTVATARALYVAFSRAKDQIILTGDLV